MAEVSIAALLGASKRYGSLQALQPTDLAIRAGEVLALLGPNGAGKTTALGLLTGRLSPDGGRALLFGQDPREFAARRRIGVMLQEARLPETLTVAELISLQSGYYAKARPLAQTLELAGLEDLAQRRYGRLSGGQQRRVQFALAICGQPPLLFVDEPTVGLDVEARRNFWQVLRQLRSDGASIVLTTHYLEEADALADRMVLLGGGRVLAEDTPAGIKARAAGKRVRLATRLPLAMIASWPEAQEVRMDGERCEICSGQPEALLRRLFAADASACDLEVLPLSLEEALLTLTADAQKRPEAA
ncbi:MAG: ABC transporter ATP-binding protein [Rhodanobacteraceae bacterium]|nr:ABC transporter ATP-binding protein [Rhodanobacteraceae bacterium]